MNSERTARVLGAVGIMGGDDRSPRRRRNTRRVWMIGWLLLVATIAVVSTGNRTPPAKAAGVDARVTCNERCQLNRRLVAVCPQATAMTRHRCIQWVQVAQCESGGQQRHVTLVSIRQIGWRTDAYHDGGLQFTTGTWTSNMGRIPSRFLTRPQRIDRQAGRYRYAFNAPPSVQILAAEVLRKRIGGNPQQSAGWPHCGAWWFG